MEDNIKIGFKEVIWRGMEWIELAEDEDRWRALVTAVITFGFRKMRGISLLAEDRLASPEGPLNVRQLQKSR